MNFLYNIYKNHTICLNLNMITTIQAVKQVLDETQMIPAEFPLELVNVSALARRIQPGVEKRLKREVQPSTLAVSIQRLIANDDLMRIELPELKIDTFNMQSGLVEVTYAKTAETTQLVRDIHRQHKSAYMRDFLTVIYGTTEISIIMKEGFLEDITATLCDYTPKALVRQLGCVSVQFSDKYLGVPNVIYVMVRALAGGNINVVEMVSTYTELAFIVAEDDLQATLGLLQREFK